MRSYAYAVIGMLVVVSIAWIGVTFVDTLSSVDTSPNADQYLTPIDPVFDEESLEGVAERSENLPVSPDVFLAIEEAITD